MEIASRKSFFWSLPNRQAAWVKIFLSEFGTAKGVSKQKRAVLLWDGAPAHRAVKLKVPERITVIQTPAYTPELNPSERVWSLVKEGVANSSCETLDELEAEICTGCQKISCEQISARTNYHWWGSQ